MAKRIEGFNTFDIWVKDGFVNFMRYDPNSYQADQISFPVDKWEEVKSAVGLQIFEADQ